jgi:tetratricopeptide (TPR) repeat protein
MRVSQLTLALAGCLALSASAQTTFPADALSLLGQGKTSEAKVLAQAVHLKDPANSEALIVLGTAALYESVVYRYEETIYHPTVDSRAQPAAVVTLPGVQTAETFWKQVPSLDPKSSVWEDLCGLYQDCGNFKLSLEAGRQAVLANPTKESLLNRVAYLAGLAGSWGEMVNLLTKSHDLRTAQLYRCLDLWRTNDLSWKTQVRAFLAMPGPPITGSKLAAWLASDQLRDTDSGYQDLLKVEPGFPNLVVKQKYAERYSEVFTVRLDLARNLSQYGNYDRALEIYLDLRRHQLAKTPEEKAALALNEAWAWEAAGNVEQANTAWKAVANAKDFYARSAACWFLGRNAWEAGQLAEARGWWQQTYLEPARSKYASWAASELKKLN